MALKAQDIAQLELSDNFLDSVLADDIIATYARAQVLGHGLLHMDIPMLAEAIIAQREKREQKRTAVIRTPEEVLGVPWNPDEGPRWI
jgi:hypothetical protein